MSTYFHATRHPWASFLFVVPLLVAYEAGVVWLGGDRGAVARNGADGWLRWQLEVFGLAHPLAAPVLTTLVLLVWSWWRWADRPADPVTTWFGMAFESCAFALLLWQFGQNYGALVERLGIRMEITVSTARVAHILTYLGAGIYEEVLFRLGLFGGTCLLLRAAGVSKPVALTVAAAAGAVLFSAAHHLGRNGEPMDHQVFVYRTLAGLFFTGLFVGRGFGVAVGAHAGYDVLVGVT